MKRDRARPFFETRTLDEVRVLQAEVPPLGEETVEIELCAGRTLARDVRAPHDLPGFARSTMDGWAVRGRDTFGAGESSPGYLKIAGEVRMGRSPDFTVTAGTCARIGTGGMIPPGADAVVMVEHTRLLDAGTVEVSQTVAPGTHVLGPDDDAAEGQTVLDAGVRLRPQDVGMLAALGVGEVPAVRRPVVGIVSTGDEVVDVRASPAGGQVRDVNTHVLSAQVRDAGGDAVRLGLVADDEEELMRKVDEGMRRCDLVLLSGGSSVGVRDLTLDVLLSFEGSRLLVHGVSVSPGKPFIWVRRERWNLLGLPGQVASCMIAFHLFVEPLMERMLGRPARSFVRFERRRAVLSRNLPALQGREAYQRVRLVRSDDGWVAEPLPGKSGLLRTLTRGDGLVCVPLGSEGFEAGRQVTVLAYPRGVRG